jgi:hypothetical protein
MGGVRGGHAANTRPGIQLERETIARHPTSSATRGGSRIRNSDDAAAVLIQHVRSRERSDRLHPHSRTHPAQ